MGPPTLSRRFGADLAPNPLHRALSAQREAGADILDLTVSNPTQVGLEAPPEALQALSDPRGAVYEPDPRGLLFARRAVCDHYHERGIELDPAQILLTASTSEAYGYLFKLLADPESSLLVPAPSYPLFDHLAEMEGVRTVPYRLVPETWRIDAQDLRRAADSALDLRAVIAVHPNNPTGSFVSKTDRELLEALCAERRIPLLADEVFSDYAFAPDPERSESFLNAPRVSTFVLSGVSKLCALPQFKMAWIVAPADAAIQERLEWIGDTYLSVTTAVQWASRRLFAIREERQRAVKNRLAESLVRVERRLEGRADIRVLHPEGGWSALLRRETGPPDEDFVLGLLQEKHVLVHPGYFFDLEEEGYLVISLLTRPAQLDAGLDRLLEYLDAGA